MTAADVVPEGFDPTDPSIYESHVPHDEFLAMRQKAPVFWIEQPDTSRAGMAEEAGTGFWAVSKHADVAAVSKNGKDFSTAENGAIIRFQEDMTRDQVELQRVMLINQDAPDHTALRQIISRGFTPRSINALHDVMKDRAVKIVEGGRRPGAAATSSRTSRPSCRCRRSPTCSASRRRTARKLFDWSNQMIAYDDPEYAIDPETAAAEILGYAMAMADDRKANPRDDIVTKLVHADVDGHMLNDDEFGFFVIMLTVAGNETTRNAITHGMNAFLDHPEQWELWKRERPESTVDEIIRWATPVSVFQRTALHDVEVGGVEVKKGQRVGLFYASANFDDDVFEDPYTFDITRTPNPHLSFGGHGAHYCIGANLARMEVKLIFDALADVAPDISKVSEPRRLRSGWINGIKELETKYS